jgi:hypothetical protein
MADNKPLNLKSLMNDAKDALQQIKDSDMNMEQLINFIKVIELRTKKIDNKLNLILDKEGIKYEK